MKILQRSIATSIICIVCFYTSIVYGTSISFEPDSSSIGISDNIDIDIVISDLDGLYVGAFDIDVAFNAAILSFDGYALTDNLGVISLFEADDWSFGDLGGGLVNLAEISYLPDLSFQSDRFTLATLSFTSLSVGASDLTISYADISDDWGGRIFAELSSGSIDVAPVPEPATMLLFGTGIAGLIGSRIRKNKSKNS